MTISKRDAIYVHAEGRSAASGELLGPDWQVDHRIPRAAGGSDDITNLQALSRAENHTKSAGLPPPLRVWQEKFVTKWNRSEAPSFLLVALPGTGKTIGALTVAHDWQWQDPVRRRLVVVVPTDPLRRQWQVEASRSFGMNFQTREFTGWKPEMIGAVITYQLLPNQAPLWKLTCDRYDVMAIFDEVHHCGENQWGIALKEAFSLAKRRLLTSGTPFRGDSVRIPFVNYDGSGQCIADDRYDYPAAIRDAVIRSVVFQHERGIVRHLSGGGEIITELNNDLSDDDADPALRAILVPGAYTEALLRLAHERLKEVRGRGMSNAGALAICRDQQHADAIAAQLARIIGHKPDVIVSDDELATSPTVDSFRDSERMWVVAVKKISEGVDIKRLMVLAYLTTTKSSLFFQQAVGRIVRNMGTEYDAEAYCFIPDHPMLVQHAQHITDAQYHAVVDDQSDDEPTQERSRESVSIGNGDLWLGTEHTGTAGAIIEGQRLDPHRAAVVKEAAEYAGCSTAVVLKLFHKFGFPGSEPVVDVDMSTSRARHSPQQRPLEDQLDDARKFLNKAVQRAAYLLLSDDPDRFPKIQHLINRYIGKPRRLFTLDECRRATEYTHSEQIRAAVEQQR